MGDGLSATGPGSPAGAANGEPRTVVPDHEPVTRLRLGDAADKAGAQAPGPEPVTKPRQGDGANTAGAETPGPEPVTRPRLGSTADTAGTETPGQVVRRQLGDAAHEAATGVPGHEPVTRRRLGSTADTAGAETPGQVTRPRLGDAADKAGAQAPGPEPVTRPRLGDAADKAGAQAPGPEPVTKPRLGDAAGLPSHPPTEVESQPAAEPAEPQVAAAPGDLVRYGPGVPAGPPAASAGLTAERVWRGGGTPGPRRRRTRLGQILGWALTVILLAASGVLLYLRFHHVPLQVTGVAIVGSGSTACSLTVTGQITTNGGQGTVTYRWLFPTGPPATEQQSVSAGQSTVNVHVQVDGTGHGMAPQRVWLQVLSPGQGTASEYILIRCP